MSNESLFEKLEALERKLYKLVHEHRSLKEELKQASSEKKQLKIIIDKQKEELKHFQNQIKISKIVTSIATDVQGSDVMKQRIDSYIEEIDKCIAHLSK